MSMFKKLMLILCFGVTTSVFYGCTQQQPGEEEGAVVEEETVEEVAVPTPTPAPTVKATESGTN